MKHKRTDHFKVKPCKYYSKTGYCKFSDQQCLYIHRHGQGDAEGQSNNQGHYQYVSNTQCWYGGRCKWAAQNACRFSHRQLNVNCTSTQSGQTQMLGSLNNFDMKALIERLEKIEQKVPNIQSLKDFPQIKGKQKIA